jgi:hypothetical protein
MNRIRAVGFRWVLPCAELALSWFALWPLRGFLIWQLESSLHAYLPSKLDALLKSAIVFLFPEPDGVWAQMFPESLLALPALVNWPCALLWPVLRWATPQGMVSEYWKALTWPLLGIFFWWIAGRAIEALVAWRRFSVAKPPISIAEVVVASVVIAMGAMLCVAFSVEPDMRDGSIYPWKWSLATSVMWVLLGASTIAARVVQRRMKGQRDSSLRSE